MSMDDYWAARRADDEAAHRAAQEAMYEAQQREQRDIHFAGQALDVAIEQFGHARTIEMVVERWRDHIIAEHSPPPKPADEPF